MMFGFGDARVHDEAALEAVSSIVESYIRGMVRPAASGAPARGREPPPSRRSPQTTKASELGRERGQFDFRCLIFHDRKHVRRYYRVLELLALDKKIQKEKSTSY